MQTPIPPKAKPQPPARAALNRLVEIDLLADCTIRHIDHSWGLKISRRNCVMSRANFRRTFERLKVVVKRLGVALEDCERDREWEQEQRQER